MRDVTNENFGLLIAYVIPGLLIVWGLSDFFPTIAAWLGSLPEATPTVGGFLFVTVASVAAGLTASTVRWAVLDTLHHATGIHPPRWNFRFLGDNVGAYQTLLEIHYRYYQFYGNGLVAMVAVFTLRRWMVAIDAAAEVVATAALAVLFFVGSRDSLRKYYRRAEQVLTDGRRTRRRTRATVSRSLLPEETPPG